MEYKNKRVAKTNCLRVHLDDELSWEKHVKLTYNPNEES